ncbi:hypothetical protein PTKIN_Ptkin14bG0156200 [Pterospermum kingtungense]
MGCGFCESAVSNSVGTLLVDWVAKPAGRQFGYLYRFDHNVQQLRRKRDELQIARDELQRKIHVAENQLLQIGDGVRSLLSKADNFLNDVESMEQEIDKNKRCFAWCPNCWWRYRLSKNLGKKEVAISQLLEKIENLPAQVGYPSTNTVSTIEFLSSSKDFIVSKASQETSKQIEEALKDDNVNKIGLWGMGGSGKTTLVREVGNQAEKSNLFDKVVFTAVSQKPNFRSIQDEIAKYLDDFKMNVEGQRRSAQELSLRLQKEKKILIILDDVWAEINLKEKIGIPLGDDHKGCKVLLTTRSLDTCHRMECQKAVQLGVLDDEEAWELFERKADLQNSADYAIKNVAGQIVKKCKGLPIAIATVGSALKGNADLHRWETTYRRLRDRRLPEIQDINDENAYKCLEVSFDYLKNKETQKCFLLCSLFPEDHEIYVEDLVRFAWGLELCGSVDSVEEVRSEVLAAVDVLKNNSLLLDSRERHVKMHDLVRDVALRIASGRKDLSFSIKSEVVESWREDESFEPYTAMFFEIHSMDELPKGLICPNLKILILLGEYGSDFSLHERLIAPEASEFRPKLQTLQLKRCRLLDISILEKLTNLRTLHLERCFIRPEISVVGKLKKLEVLSFRVSNIKELPKEIGDLNNLKLLDLSYCKDLQRIPSHLIQRLSKLEELYLHGCRSISWATENTTSDEMYASLLELTSLQKLTVLSLEVALIHLPKDFVFQGLERYEICINGDVPFDAESTSQSHPIMRSLRIEASGIDACKQLFQDLETLHLKNWEGR